MSYFSTFQNLFFNPTPQAKNDTTIRKFADSLHLVYLPWAPQTYIFRGFHGK